MSTFSPHIQRLAAVLGLVLAGSLALAIGPSGILADQHQESDEFGIEQFQPVTISMDSFTDLEAVAEDVDPMTMIAAYVEFQDLGEFETDISEESFREVESLDEVDQHLDGAFLQPEDLPNGLDNGDAHFMVGDAGSASYTFDVEKARRISELLELPADWLPDSSEHSELTVAVNVPESGAAAWTSDDEKLLVGQVGSPELDIPDEIDLDALRDAIVTDARMPEELAGQLQEIEDWKRTLPVPVPEDAEYQDITVDGDDGMVLSHDEGSILVWVSDGTLHVIAGTYDADTLEDIAQAMQ